MKHHTCVEMNVPNKNVQEMNEILKYEKLKNLVKRNEIQLN